MCDCDYYDRPVVFRQVIRRARKRHRCGECLGLINPRTHYYEARGLWDGRWSTHKTCGSCHVIANTLLECYAYGQIEECLDYELDLRERGNPGRIALAGIKRRCRHAEKILKPTKT